MKDTEPMPAVRAPQAVASPAARRLGLATAAAVLALSFVLFLIAWKHYEFASLRAEVREARAAAETATRAANRAALAAQAAQAAAGNLGPSTADTESSQNGGDGSN